METLLHWIKATVLIVIWWIGSQIIFLNEPENILIARIVAVLGFTALLFWISKNYFDIDMFLNMRDKRRREKEYMQTNNKPSTK